MGNHEETIYNLFCFISRNVILEIALCRHQFSGSDREKAAALVSKISEDLATAQHIRLSEALNYDDYLALHRLGKHLLVFEPLLESVGAPKDVFCCITPVVDGEPRIDLITDHSPLSIETMQCIESRPLVCPEDWLVNYTTRDGFHLCQLLNDDYFLAIRMLFNARHYLACTKLLLSFIDTISFLAYGDESAVFIKWLDTYADVQRLGITSAELWEMRNGMLHMSNLDSRKVVNNTVRRISICIAPRGYSAPPDREITYFNLVDLIDVIANGLSNWAKTYNEDKCTFVGFVARYDRIVSDNRLVHFEIHEKDKLE